MTTYPHNASSSNPIRDIIVPTNRRGHSMTPMHGEPLVPLSPALELDEHHCYEHVDEPSYALKTAVTWLVALPAGMNMPSIQWRPKRYDVKKGIVTNWRAIVRYRDVAMSGGVLLLMVMFSMLAMWAVPYYVPANTIDDTLDRPAFMARAQDEPHGILAATSNNNSSDQNASIPMTPPQRTNASKSKGPTNMATSVMNSAASTAPVTSPIIDNDPATPPMNGPNPTTPNPSDETPIVPTAPETPPIPNPVIPEDPSPTVPIMVSLPGVNIDTSINVPL